MFETCFQAQVDSMWAVTTNKWVTDGNRITDTPPFYYHLPLEYIETQWLGDQVWVIMESISYKLHSPREIFMASCKTSFWFTSFFFFCYGRLWAHRTFWSPPLILLTSSLALVVAHRTVMMHPPHPPTSFWQRSIFLCLSHLYIYLYLPIPVLAFIWYLWFQ